jgi:hypothetical protein
MVRLLAEDFGTGQVVWSLLWFVVFFIWIWLAIGVFSDIFRSHDLSGAAKMLWVVFIVVLPYLGVLAYLLARGGKMHEHAIERVNAADAAARRYIKRVASSPADEIAKLASLRSSGVIDDAEFERLKARIVGSPTAATT